MKDYVLVYEQISSRECGGKIFPARNDEKAIARAERITKKINGCRPFLLFRLKRKMLVAVKEWSV